MTVGDESASSAGAVGLRGRQRACFRDRVRASPSERGHRRLLRGRACRVAAVGAGRGRALDDGAAEQAFRDRRDEQRLHGHRAGRLARDRHLRRVAAQVAAHPALHRQRTENRRTLVIFDEIHHAGDALSWGDAVTDAFDPARRRLALTGTPFRSDANPIPFVTYLDEPGGGKRSASDYVYGYGPALEDGVVRPVIFLAYSGEMRWRTRAGDEITATLGTPMTKDQIAQAWRTALDPAGEWVSRVLEAADKRLTEVVGSGPFVFRPDLWKPGSSMVLDRNPDYVPRQEPPDFLSG